MPRRRTSWETEFYSRIGRRVRAYRQQRRISAQKLADLTGTSEPAVLGMELGRQYITIGFLWRVSAVLDVPLECFIPRRAQLGQPDLPRRVSRHPDVRGGA